MNEDVLKQIKNGLKLEYYIMNDEWLKDCIEFYISQHKNPSTEEILQFVKVQWQLSDLREINNENGSLPHDLLQQKRVVLSKNYILQVQQMYDISTSKYKQLEKIRNIHTSEVDLSEAEKLEKWEPPKKRMIQLQLTDGLQDVIGIEYKYIPQLNDTLLPGYKVMIIGPVECIKGVLLLEEKMLKGIGGEVDSLLIPNALENVLARALNLEENPDPYNDNQIKTNEIRQEEAQIDDNFFEEEFDINLDEVSKIENSHNNINKSNMNTIKTQIETDSATNYMIRTKNKHVPDCYEDIMDDDDCFMEMINDEHLLKSQTKHKHIVAPYRIFQEEENGDIIIINEEDEMTTTENRNIKHSVKGGTCSSESSSKLHSNKTDSSLTPLHSKMDEEDQLLLNIGKRNVSMSPCEKILKKCKIDRKITEFTETSNFLEEPKICEFIHDVNKEFITETTFKTIRGQVDILGKLAKKDSLWVLEAVIGDGTGTIKVSFSNKVLEELLGFTVKEFSMKKKLKKNPEIENELRMSCRTAEQRIKTMDALLDLQLNVNETPIVIKITDLTQEQKQLIDRQLRKFFLKNNM